MKFAFIIMGDFSSPGECASVSRGEARIAAVSGLREACVFARKFAEEGIGCIDLCGAFGEEGARAVVSATEGKSRSATSPAFPSRTRSIGRFSGIKVNSVRPAAFRGAFFIDIPSGFAL